MNLTIKDELSNGYFVLNNYKELKDELNGYLEKFKGLIFSDDEIKKAKEIKAELNKIAKAMNQRRLDKEKEYMSYFQPGKDQINDLINDIKEVSNFIDIQVKTFEEKEDAIKREAIENIWLTKEFNDVKLEKIFNPKWLNKTCSLMEISKEMDNKITSIIGDIKIIKGYVEDADFIAYKAEYLETLNVQATLGKYDNVKAIQSKIQETSTTSTEVDYKVPLYDMIIKVTGTAKDLQDLVIYAKKTMQVEILMDERS